jgi:hypothetical protein
MYSSEQSSPAQRAHLKTITKCIVVQDFLLFSGMSFQLHAAYSIIYFSEHKADLVFVYCYCSVSFLSSSHPSQLQQHAVASSSQTHQHQSHQHSISVSTTISDLTILEFILWTTNLRK